MASGATLFVLSPLDRIQPTANYATDGSIADTSSPPHPTPVLEFDGGADEWIYWDKTVPSAYSGTTGWDFSYKYAVDGSDTDAVDMEFRVLPIADATILTGDLGIDQQTAVSIQDTPPATPANKWNESGSGSLAKADMGTPTEGQRVIIAAKRDTTVSPANTDTLQLGEVLVKET